jgi:uronate dehydrogenase
VSGTVLLTGSAGRIGRVVGPGLAELGWRVRGYDRRATPDLPDSVVGDIRDGAAVQAALSGVDALVHLAAHPMEAPFPVILDANLDGTFQVFDAARRAGVRRVVYASSNHAVGFTPRQPLAPADTAPRPDTYYGVSKVFGEALARMYADRYGMEFACLRIGTFGERPRWPRDLSTWLSPRDTVNLVHACLTTPELGYQLLFAVSANTRSWWDLRPARALGYEPVDDAEAYAAEVIAEWGEPDPDDPKLAVVGGDFTGPDFDADRLVEPERR